jgi:flagellar FliL protein
VRLAVDQHMPSLRNALVMLFGTADFKALKTVEGKQALQEEALKALQEIMTKELGKPGIEQVLFTEFVLQ